VLKNNIAYTSFIVYDGIKQRLVSMKKDYIPPLVSLVAVLAITQGEFTSSLISLLIAGVVPGTSFVLPSWMMMTVYCLAITAIITLYLEGALGKGRAQRSSKHHKRQLPRRRFTNI
jgi:protein-S-isoprenylcysteine O-methyltransferase Ste14